MSMPAQHARLLIQKIQSLPAERAAEVEDFVDFLRERTRRRYSPAPGKDPLDFPVDDLGPWPEGLSLSRTELYGDDGR